MMMNRLLQSGVSNTWCKQCGISRLFRVPLHTSTQYSGAPTKSDTLFGRISPLGDPRVSIAPTLDQWVEEGRNISRGELHTIVKQLRKFRRFKQALELSEWMSNKTYFELLPGDVAVRLDLISKVHGIQQAEEYFNDISDELRVYPVYGALLNCYTKIKSLEKAEATLQKMREMGFAQSQYSYNVMMNLYSLMGKHEKLETLIQEMEEKGISYDKFTYSIILNAYAASSNIKGLENLIMKMEADPTISMDWVMYGVAANGYRITGQMDKALATLKKSEQLIRFNTRKSAYGYLLTMYGRMGYKDEVNHIWNLCKRTGKIYNSTYLSMMRSVYMLGDLDYMEKIFEDWEANNTSFDFRIPNILVNAYHKKGLLGKAESLVYRLIESGKEPNAITWDLLATGYHRYDHMEKAVDTMKKAIMATEPRYKPSIAVLAACMEYLKGKGDDEVAEFITLLEKEGHSIEDIHDRIEKYIKGGNPES